MKICYLIALMEISFISASDNFEIDSDLLKMDKHIAYVKKKLLQITAEKDLLNKKKDLLPENYKSQSKEELIERIIRLEKKNKKLINLSFACHRALIFLLEEKKSFIDSEKKWADLCAKRSLLFKKQQNHIEYLQKKNEDLLASIKELYEKINIKNNKINELIYASTDAHSLINHVHNWFDVNF